jgi:hypothetical protein
MSTQVPPAPRVPSARLTHPQTCPRPLRGYSCRGQTLRRGAGLRFATLQDTVLAARPGGAQLVTLQSAADVDSGAACNQLCLQHGGAGAAPAQNCTVWQYCGNATGGCPGGGGGQPGLAPRTCLLQSLPGAGAGFAQAPCTLADCRAAPANRSLLGAPAPLRPHSVGRVGRLAPLAGAAAAVWSASRLGAPPSSGRPACECGQATPGPPCSLACLHACRS